MARERAVENRGIIMEWICVRFSSHSLRFFVEQKKRVSIIGPYGKNAGKKQSFAKFL